MMTLLEALEPATFGLGFGRCFGVCYDEPELMLFGKLVRVVGPKIDEPVGGMCCPVAYSRMNVDPVSVNHLDLAVTVKVQPILWSDPLAFQLWDRSFDRFGGHPSHVVAFHVASGEPSPQNNKKELHVFSGERIDAIGPKSKDFGSLRRCSAFLPPCKIVRVDRCLQLPINV